MANVIKHKRGSGSDPVANDLVVGEVAIRTDVGKLFTKMDNGSVAEIAGGGSDIAINTLSSSSGTGGGSATFNGSAFRFTLSAPPSVSAQQLLVSINGVIQKPVAGTGQPSEGFSVDGTDIILGDAPATGSDFFILTFKSLGVSEPADNSVTSAKIADGAIVNADINASAAIAGSKISPNFGSQGITTTGSLGASGFSTTGGEIALTGAVPRIGFTDSNANSDFRIKVDGGSFQIEDITNSSADRLVIDSSGRVGIGTSSPTSAGSYTKFLQISDNNSASVAISRSASGSAHTLELGAFSGASLIESTGATSLRFKTNSSERMRIDSSGNVGIGTTSPTDKLHVVGDVGFELGTELFDVLTTGSGTKYPIRLLNADASAGNKVGIEFGAANNVACSRIAGIAENDFTSTANRDGGITFESRLNGTFSEAMRINSSGNVSIGTSVTNQFGHKLCIEDTSGAIFYAQHSTSGIQLKLNLDNTNNVALFGTVSSDALQFVTANNNALRIDSSGRLLLGTTTVGAHEGGNNFTIAESGHCGMTIRSSTSTSGNIYFADGTSSGESARGEISYRHATDDLRIFTSAHERMRIDSNGDVLIGTTTAVVDTKLVVAGNINQFNPDTGTGASTKSYVLGRSYTMSTSSTNILTFDNWGTSAFDITVFRRDNAAPAGAQVIKLYLAFHGSGTNITQASIAQENKVLRGSIHNVDFGISENNNTATLTVTGDDNGGETQDLTFYIMARGNGNGTIVVV